MLSLMPSHELLTIAGLLAMALGMECSPVTAEVTHNSYNCFSFTFSDCTSFRVFTVLAGVCWQHEFAAIRCVGLSSRHHVPAGPRLPCSQQCCNGCSGNGS